MKKLLLIIFACIPIFSFSQFNDDFSDGDFTTNPTWLGDTGVFEIQWPPPNYTNAMLRLNDVIANTSYLSTPSNAISNSVWIFNVKLDFSPSTNNYAKVYLASDMIDLTGPLNGMFVKIGGQTGTIDDISLYTQNGINSTKIIDGTDGLAANNPDLRVKVTRDVLGNWELLIDTNGVFFTEGIAFDNSIITSNFFGVYCKYTITRSDKFWFDDFHISGSAFVFGCTDSTACNYNPLATMEDSSCLIDYGCMDTIACNYDSNATCDDGSCLIDYGCTDPTACNYDPIATCDDGSCDYSFGCTDSNACNYDATALCDDGSCLTAWGCTDTTACNYNANATCNDGSCDYSFGCMDTTACNYDSTALCDDGSCLTAWGCTDTTACNYDSTATCDDGSCSGLWGCTDTTACNYDSLASCDDGNCGYSPAANFNANSVCIGDTILFTDLSTSTNSIISWNWNFGDGGLSSSTQNPSYIYSTGGYYDVNLVIIDNNGCTDSVSHIVEIYANPVADFVVSDSICVLDTASFINMSINGSAPIYIWNWNFGLLASPQTFYHNNWTGIPPHPDTISVIFSVSGEASIMLDVMDTNSCHSSISYLIMIYNCEGPSSTPNIMNTEKVLYKITDMLGQETPHKKNIPLFYIYDDGTVEKRITIE